jgi:hypothetical protein
VSDDTTYPTEGEERVARIENMQADTRLKEAQYKNELRKMTISVVGLLIAGMGAGAGLLAGMVAIAKWYSGH